MIEKIFFDWGCSRLRHKPFLRKFSKKKKFCFARVPQVLTYCPYLKPL